MNHVTLIIIKHFLRFVLLAWIPLNSSTQVKQIDSQNNTITKFPYFYPPDGWEMIDPNLLSPKVLVGFVKKTKQGFLPSMNLAIEDVDISLSQYIKEVKKLYEVTDSVWRDLGSFITSEGKARLTEIDTKCKWGNVRMLQMILIKDNKAYIFTASALKEEFSLFYPEIKKAFQSFKITSDLFSLVNPEQRDLIKDESAKLLRCLSSSSAKSSEQAWKDFQLILQNEFNNLGSFWQLEILREMKKLSQSEHNSKDA